MIGSLWFDLTNMSLVHVVSFCGQILGNLAVDPACKAAISQMRGFEKMFALLVGADDELQSEILKTLRTFLDLERTLQPASVASSSASAAGSALTGTIFFL